MKNTLRGTVIELGAVNKISDSFSKRDLVIRTHDTYPEEILIEVTNKKMDILDPVNVGDSVEVSINIVGREYQGRRFVNIRGWELSVITQAPQSAPMPIDEAPTAQATTAPAATDGAKTPGTDDLPF